MMYEQNFFLYLTVDENGRKDFYRVLETVIFPAGMSQKEVMVFLPFYDDDINENTEGYLAMVRINESASDPQDVVSANYIRNGIALIVINDDDRKNLHYIIIEKTISALSLLQINGSCCYNNGSYNYWF